MNLANLLDRIAGKQHERQQARESDFRTLVAEIADGKDPNPDSVDHVLTDTSRSIDDLRQAVELLLHRRQPRQTWNKATKMAKDRERIRKDIAEADTLLEQAESHHEETTAPLYAHIEMMKQAIADADRARRELWETCSYPELCDELTRVTQRLEALHKQRASAEKEANDLRQWAESDRQKILRVAYQSKETELRERADRYDRKAKKLESDVAGLRLQIEQLAEEEKQLRNQMLEP